MLLFLVLLTLTLLFLSIITRFRTNRIPGPTCLPIIGYIPALYTPLPKLLNDLARDYGEICAVSLGKRKIVLLNSTKAIKEAFRLEALQGRPQDYLPIRSLLEAGETGCTFVERKLWRSGRKAIVRYLSKVPNQKVEYLMEKYAELCISEIRKLEEKPTETFRIFIRFTGSFILELVGYQDSGSGFCDILPAGKVGNRTTKEILRVADYYPIFKLFYWRSVREAFTDAQHMAGNILMQTFKKLETKDSTEATIRHLTLDLYDAGAFTSAETLVWASLLLAIHPEVQEAIFKELREILHHKPCLVSDLPKLPLIHSTVCEVFRTSNVTGYGLPHKTLADVRIEGYTVPKDSTIIANYAFINSCSIQVSPKLDPLHSVKAPTLAFGLGKRRCPGEKLATQFLQLQLARLLQEFKLELSEPEDRLAAEQPVISLTVTPGKHKIVFRKRKNFV